MEEGSTNILLEPLKHVIWHQVSIAVADLEDLDPIAQSISADVPLSVFERFGVDFGGKEGPVGSLPRGEERVDAGCACAAGAGGVLVVGMRDEEARATWDW